MSLILLVCLHGFDPFVLVGHLAIKNHSQFFIISTIRGAVRGLGSDLVYGGYIASRYHFSILSLSLNLHHLTNYLNYHLTCAPDWVPHNWRAHDCSHDPVTNHLILTLDSSHDQACDHHTPNQSGARLSDRSLTYDLVYHIQLN